MAAASAAAAAGMPGRYKRDSMKAFPFSKVNGAYSSVGFGSPYLCGARLARLSPHAM
jgi:hypothetical protein